MIQRIQTVYLFLTSCLMAMLEFLPFTASLAVLVSAGAVAVLAIFTIFLYKKRKLQVKIGYVMLLLIVLTYALYFIFNRQQFPVAELIQRLPFTFIFPLIAGILVYLAIYRIKKDEKLVRSLDRLR